MVVIEEYRERVQQLLAQYRGSDASDEEVEAQLVADTKHDHYQLVNVGWEDGHRVYGCMIHIDIKGDKVWVQQNLTEQEVAEDLVELGIPKECIVLGFQPPYMRKFTEFAVN